LEDERWDLLVADPEQSIAVHKTVEDHIVIKDVRLSPNDSNDDC